MSETPSPINKSILSKATLAAFGLAAFGVALFIGLWVLLDSDSVQQFTRLIISLCIPPAVIAAIVGIYFLVHPSNSK